jgi:hypothetical protein
MYRSRALSLAAMTVLGLALLPGSAVSQQKSLKEQLVGTWRLLIDDEVRPDGSKNPIFGPNPNGIVIFDAGGHYALELARTGNPKFKSNNRTQGTPDENKAVVGGTLAHFGAYSLDEASKTLTFRIEASSFPNWEGTVQKREITLNGDDLKWITPQASGGGTAELYWRRIK